MVAHLKLNPVSFMKSEPSTLLYSLSTVPPTVSGGAVITIGLGAVVTSPCLWVGNCGKTLNCDISVRSRVTHWPTPTSGNTIISPACSGSPASAEKLWFTVSGLSLSEVVTCLARGSEVLVSSPQFLLWQSRPPQGRPLKLPPRRGAPPSS